MDRKKTTTSLVILIVTVLLIAGAVVLANNAKTDTTTTSSTNNTQTIESSTVADTGDNTFTQGTYDATGEYQSPGGNEKIKISLTIGADGTVTSADAQSRAVSSDGHQFQKKFISGYKSQVIGKKINDIDLDQVSGSSLTPIGFNDAVSKIQDQAKA